MSTESDFDKIYSQTVNPSYKALEELWNKHGAKWLEHISGGLCGDSYGTEMEVYKEFSELSAEEQFAFWAWTRETKINLK